MTKSKNILKKWNLENVRELFLEHGLLLISEKYGNTTEKLLAKTKEGYKVVASVNKLCQNRVPSVFCNRNPYTIENLYLYFDKNGIKSKILDKEIKNSKQDIKFKCECGNIFYKKLSNILKTSTCRCNDCRYKATQDFLKHDIEYIRNFIESYSNSGCKLLSNIYENNETKLKLKCKCGNTFYKTFSKFKDRQQICCNDCAMKNKKPRGNIYSFTDIKNRIEEIAPNECELIEYKNSRTKMKLKCKICGNVYKVLPSSFFSGARCKCNTMSHGERKIYKYLIENKIIFNQEQTFKGLKSNKNFPLRIDFYLPQQNIAIEYDGEFHYKNMDLRHSDLSYQVSNDEIKNEYCENNKIKLLRIPYWEFDNIENILKSAL